MRSMRKQAVSAGLLIAMGSVALTLQAGCAGGQEKKQVATVSGGSQSDGQKSTGAPKNVERPRHRVDQSDEDRQRLIQPWEKCMKDNGADTEKMPNNDEGAKRWAKEHQRARDTCLHLLPLLPWGMDKANPEYRDNIHAWVKCMNDKGMNVIATPDNDESPWRYGGEHKVSGAEAMKIEQDCEKATIGKSDR